MMQVVTPSEITLGQISKLQETLGAALRKSGFSQEAVQRVLETQGEALTAEWLAALQKRVDTQSNQIVRRAAVDRKRSPKAALEATQRNLYVNNSVVAAMPRGEGEEVEVIFFKVGRRYVSDADLEKEYERRGLKPADPYSLAAVNEVDPTFAVNQPNCTHWKDSSGRWSCIIFDDWRGRQEVRVCDNDDGWHNNKWWFAGQRT